MALDDYVESEVAIAVAATAAIFSPRVRGVLRQGAVYGVAGLLVVGDAGGSFARGIGRGAQNAARTTADVAGTAVDATTDAAGSAAGAMAGAAGSAAGTVTGTTDHAAGATTHTAENAMDTATSTPESGANAASDGGGATSTTPATPEAAADELTAVARGTTDGTPTSGRRSRRAQAEQTEDVPNE